MSERLGPDDPLPRPSAQESFERDPALEPVPPPIPGAASPDVTAGTPAPRPVPAPPSLPDADEVSRQTYRRLDVFKDNLEAFTVALVMALVIKHFCVEAFKIPTGSMMPTLYGEKNSPEGIGDRILVDKWAYLTQAPQRWDVVVFRYPLNQSKHFIKRVGGIGGEWMKIVRGDVWTRKSEEEPWRIATKPRRARDELYLPVYPPAPPGPNSWYHDEMPAADVYWEPAPAWRVDDYTTLAFQGGPTSTIAFRQRIGRQSEPDDYDLDLGRSELVLDIRAKMTVTPNASGRFALRWTTGEDAVCELKLTPADEAGSVLRTRRGDVDLEVPIPVYIVSGRAIELELEYVDGHVWAHLDGQVFGPLDELRDIDTGRSLEDFSQRLEIEATGGGFKVEGIQFDRDVHYVTKSMPGLGSAGAGVQVPEDHFFMLGDNTEGSSDSRQWELSGRVLKDGRTIWYESGSSENRPRKHDDGTWRVVDRGGVERRWLREDEETTDRKPQPFVNRDLIVGRAFFIFWPVWPDFPGRSGFIH